LRVLILATTTGYQTRSFGEAAERLGVELVFATDRCRAIDDPWRDGAIPIRFFDEADSVDAIVRAAEARPIDGILVVGDRPTVIAARVARALGLPGHPPAAATAARHKRLTREHFRDAGLPTPWFIPLTIDGSQMTVDSSQLTVDSSQAVDRGLSTVDFPCVVKPVALSGSRGVMRVDDDVALKAAIWRLRSLLASPDIRAERSDAHRELLVEQYIPGHEYALEGVLDHGRLHPFAIFDKPDPLDGPFFEETIYVTPPPLASSEQDVVVRAVADAAAALGLVHGPIHAELRVNRAGVFVLEVAARPIGGLCARAVRFDDGASLEEKLLRHALGESPERWARESQASGVMMIPIPRRGIFRGVAGVEAAHTIPGVDDVRLTAKLDQVLLPLPEGASYLGFIFAHGASADEVVRALRASHHTLHFTIDPDLQVVQSHHG
jgi:biotin carboxylase